MEGWSREAEHDRDVLMSIVALLVSLAGFADRAGELRGRRRWQLLQILCYAETVGFDFISGLMPARLLQCEELELDGDAARLAASFRVLALVLYTMLQRRPAVLGAIRPRAGGRQIFAPAVRLSAAAAYDTS